KGGALIKLQSQQFQLLALLVERRGEIVNREEIRQALWDDQTFVDFDRSINLSVNRTREALGDDPQSPRYIETLPRKGYRFIAPVIESAAEHVETSQAVASRWWWLLAAGAAMILVAVVVAAKMPWRAKPIESLAVLPLENLSHDPAE